MAETFPSEDTVRLRVGGFEPLTTVDWEGRLSAVVFLQGCPWRCRYCHNAELAALTAPGMRPWAEIRQLLEARVGFLDAVIFSGGEPTIQSDLPHAAEQVAELGFEVALHTNGFDPNALSAVLTTGAIDFVALDIKAPFEDYELITQVPRSGDGARRSLRVVLDSGIAHELRTTYHPALLSADHLRQIARELAEAGAERWIIQLFRPQGCPVRWLRESIALPAHVSAELRAELSALLGEVEVRGTE